MPYDSGMKALRNFSVFIAACLLSACVAPSPYAPRNPPQTTPQGATESGLQTQPATVPEAAAPAQSLPGAASHPRTLSSASKALVAQAQTQLNAGNDAMAAATIERALRIDPDSPLLWIELAKIRQDSGNPAQAENLARKALSMAAGDNKAQAAAWRVIAESYRARGRNPEARDADAKANAVE
jgi:Tfp pilus assembly protein PilF